MYLPTASQYLLEPFNYELKRPHLLRHILIPLHLCNNMSRIEFEGRKAKYITSGDEPSSGGQGDVSTSFSEHTHISSLYQPLQMIFQLQRSLSSLDRNIERVALGEEGH